VIAAVSPARMRGCLAMGLLLLVARGGLCPQS
jgi:hypothetical protein